MSRCEILKCITFNTERKLSFCFAHSGNAKNDDLLFPNLLPSMLSCLKGDPENQMVSRSQYCVVVWRLMGAIHSNKNSNLKLQRLLAVLQEFWNSKLKISLVRKTKTFETFFSWIFSLNVNPSISGRTAQMYRALSLCSLTPTISLAMRQTVKLWATEYPHGRSFTF